MAWLSPGVSAGSGRPHTASPPGAWPPQCSTETGFRRRPGRGELGGSCDPSLRSPGSLWLEEQLTQQASKGAPDSRRGSMSPLSA